MKQILILAILLLIGCKTKTIEPAASPCIKYDEKQICYNNSCFEIELAKRSLDNKTDFVKLKNGQMIEVYIENKKIKGLKHRTNCGVIAFAPK